MMWMKYGLLIVLAVCLLPDDVHSQGFCCLCNPSCTVKIQGTERRLDYYNGNMYYFASDIVNAKRITWNEANSTCTGLFKSQNGWSGPSGNLASFQTKQEYDFIWNKMTSYSIQRTYIGGMLDGSEWKWTDGTQMNQTLIGRGKNSLWGHLQPSGDGKRMEIWKQGPNHLINGLNDLGASIVRPDMFSYMCKIPCAVP